MWNLIFIYLHRRGSSTSFKLTITVNNLWITQSTHISLNWIYYRQESRNLLQINQLNRSIFVLCLPDNKLLLSPKSIVIEIFVINTRFWRTKFLGQTMVEWSSLAPLLPQWPKKNKKQKYTYPTCYSITIKILEKIQKII